MSTQFIVLANIALIYDINQMICNLSLNSIDKYKQRRYNLYDYISVFGHIEMGVFMAKGFSEREKEKLKERLIIACKESWTKYGYKKTSVDDLCKQVGISKGAFYLFFSTKEDLFGEVLCFEQQKIYETANAILANSPTKTGIVNALQFVYKEYGLNNFLHDANNSDFYMLTTKLSPDRLLEIKRLSDLNNKLFIEIPNVKLKVSKEMVAAIIYSLIMGIKNKDILPNHYEVYNFLLEHLVEELYDIKS